MAIDISKGDEKHLPLFKALICSLSFDFLAIHHLRFAAGTLGALAPKLLKFV